MPYWTREVIPRKLVLVPMGGTETVLSDADAVPDGLRADQARGFVEVEAIDGPCELRVFRFIGATEDALYTTDTVATLILSTVTVANLEWEVPLAPYFRTRVDVVNTGAGPAASIVFRVLQTCRTLE